MKKWLLLLLFSPFVGANNMDTETKGEIFDKALFDSIREECVNTIAENVKTYRSQFDKLENLGFKIDSDKICTCFAQRMKVEFKRSTLEEEINQGDISLNEITQRIEALFPEKKTEAMIRNCNRAYFKQLNNGNDQ